MKGEFHFHVKSKKLLFEFSIRRNITIIKGDSATGKTTLVHMLYEYLRVGKESGYSVTTNANYYVYMRPEVGRDWKEALFPLQNTVIFIEENNDFIFCRDFADFVKMSGNYFVLISRSPLKMLPYSIHEIYKIVTLGKHADIKESYHAFRELYSNYPLPENNRLHTILTEDSNAGYQFFSKIFSDSLVSSANGNGNIIKEIKKTAHGDTLVIADGAAFGALIEDCLESFETINDRRISLWLPESFEFLILKSGLIQSKELTHILEATSDYVNCSEFESWEQFYTKLLISLTEHTAYRYSKNSLPAYYLLPGNREKILAQFPAALKKKVR